MVPRRRGDAGMVSAELAAALPVLVLLAFVGISAVRVVDARVRCLDAAREVVRAAARGDPAALASGRRVAPAGASIALSHPGSGQVGAIVSTVVYPTGTGLAGVTVRESAVGALEPNGGAPG